MNDDNYEKFKEWVKSKEIDIKDLSIAVKIDVLFDEFELEQKEKEKENEIKQTILDAIKKTPLNVEYIPYEFGKAEFYLTEPVVNTIYNDLKEKDLIK